MHGPNYIEKCTKPPPHKYKHVSLTFGMCTRVTVVIMFVFIGRCHSIELNLVVCAGVSVCYHSSASL